MASINDILGDAGAGYSFPFLDRQLTMKPMTLKREGQFEQWIEGRAFDAAQATASRIRKAVPALWARYRELQDGSGAEGLAQKTLDEIDAEMKQLAIEARTLAAQADSQIDNFGKAKTAGAFEYQNDLAQASLNSFAGSVHLIWLMLQPHHPDIAEDAVAAWYRDEANRRVLNEAVKRTEGIGPKPPSSPPQTTGTTWTTPTQTKAENG